MFTTLLESRATRTRRTGGSLLSILLHGTLIAAAVVVTSNAASPDASVTPLEEITFTKPVSPPPVPPAPTPDQVFTAAPPPKGFQVLIPPIDIPSVLPSIDLTAPPTSADDFSGRGTPGGAATGVDATAAPPPINGVYSDDQVERPVVALSGNTGPQYPEMLRSAGIEGQVLAQFVVDTTGRAAVATFVALSSDHALFTAAVRAALGRMRFVPAEVGGRKVAQLVRQPFQFSVSR